MNPVLTTTTDLRAGFCRGFSMTPARTQEEVACAMGISRVMVLRLEKSAMRKLRALPETRILWEMLQSLPPSSDPTVSIHLG